MSGPVRVVVSGAGGRMGHALAGLMDGEGEVEWAGGIGREPRESDGIAGLDGAADLIREADVVIDFSAPDFLGELLETHGTEMGGRALVVGTTGLGDAEERLLARRAEAGPVLVAANFSVGVNVLLSLVRDAARALEGYDVEIVEAHHRRKEDAPSGTALALGEAVADGRGLTLDRVRRDGRSGRPGPRPDGEIGFHAVRGGQVVGDHEVLFLGEMERVELVHRASDRTLFAAGALRAARWLSGRPAGRYTMLDVLGIT
jgi:4-hydroxy-tetrahydrodipicolinate reductase